MRLRKPSPATLIALLALFVALGGSSYAALQLPNGSVGTRQLKNGAVTSKKVKNNSLLVRDFRASQRALLRGPQGERGERGLQGVQGVQGVQGPSGRSALTPLQPGETIRGIIGARYQVGATAVAVFGAVASFPIPAAVALDNAHVVVDGTADEPANECTGSTTNVTAPAGFVCIYPDIVLNATFAADAGQTGVTGTRTLGFMLDWSSTTANQQTSVRAEWAYTAP
jgi:hypothetical protein